MSIEVYARSVNESVGWLLATLSNAAEVKELVEHMKESGIYCDGDMHREVATQYVVDGDSAYFEIIVG